MTPQKPDDWDEEAPPKIVDASAVMPAGWLEDEPEMVADPEAEENRRLVSQPPQDCRTTDY